MREGRRVVRLDAPGEANILRDASVAPLLARVLAARGVREAAEIDYSLSRMSLPDGLSGLQAAAALLADAVRGRRRILVIGDFDADGATSTALMLRALGAFGARDVDYLVPNRFEFGYGLTPEIVAVAARRSPDLIVTVDNGTASLEGVRCARDAGIDVIVTDHHLPGERLPDANAIVNPNLPGEQFEGKSLAGVGVAFYVLGAVRRRLREEGWFDGREQPALATFLDLVALGTIADVVALDRNNRVLVHQGLRRIRAGRCCPGIAALLEVGGRHTHPVYAADLAFGVAPQLNAAGRLTDMSLGIECLLSDDPDEARELALRLRELNLERRGIEARMREQGETLLAEIAFDARPPMALSLYRADWHQGVIGIVAARLRERTNRPVVAFADDPEPGFLKGSARSIESVHIRDAIERVSTRHPGLVTRFGGHAAAAGVTLPREQFEHFRRALAEEVDSMLGGAVPDDALVSDGAMAAADLTLANAELLRLSGVWGKDFSEPQFDGEFDVLSSRVVGDAHLKLVLKHPDGGPLLDAIAFRCTRELSPGERVRLVYRLEVNDYEGRRRLQLNVQHVEPA